jgi:chromosomal replication initiator protein
VTGEQFTNEYITAIRTNAIDAFRQKIRKLDLLAIDDVHFLSNKVRTQTEFLYTLDAIDLSGARVVLASDNHPHHIKRFDRALVSRFLSGMVVKIDRPDRSTRIELIRRLAATRGLRLNEAAVDAIAGNCVGSVREIEGAITKLAAYKALMNGHANGQNGNGRSNGHSDDHGEIGLLLVEQLFKEQTWHGANGARVIRMAAVIDAVCQRLGVGKSDLMGSGRHRRVVLARALVAYLGREADDAQLS